jgi:hypothetical protein
VVARRSLLLVCSGILGGVAIGLIVGRVTATGRHAQLLDESAVLARSAPEAEEARELERRLELARLKQQIVEELRREQQGRTPPSSTESGSAAVAPPDPAAGAAAAPGPAPTAENEEAAQRVSDLLARVEEARTLSQGDHADFFQLIGKMDPESRQKAISRLAQGINTQKIKPTLEAH